jgi:hypothetical protein
VPCTHCLEAFLLPEFHPARWTVGQEDDAGRHLLGKTKHVRGIRTRGLETDGIASDQRARDGIGRGRDGAEHRMFQRVVLQAPREQAKWLLPSAFGARRIRLQQCCRRPENAFE